jgi:ABC-type transport system involved in multi-copper enzyme maturation permease subunit
MFRNLILKEIQLNLKNLRFQVAFVIVLFVFITGSLFNVKETRQKQEMYSKYQTQWFEEMRKQAEENITFLATRTRNYLLRPRDNSFISDCKERFIPNTITYNAFNVYGFENKQTISNPLLNRFEEINWSFIVIFVISILALLLTFDAISGERETHTLALCCANQVSRAQILFSKWLSVVLLISITLLTGIFISLIIQGIAKVIVISSALIAESCLFLLLSMLLTALMSCLGLLCSVMASSSNVSLLYALTFWLLFALVIPNTSVLWAAKLFPVENAYNIEQQRVQKRQQIDASYPAGKWSSSGNPFMPEHKIRAAMQMDFMLSDKQINDSYYQAMFNQYESSRNITGISPLLLFGYGMETITGGGYLRFQHNWDALHIYQQQFLDFFKNFDTKDKDSPHWYNPYEVYSTTRKPVKFEEVPVYTEVTPPLKDRIAKMASYGGLLLIYTFFVFIATFIRFIRSDVR